MSTANNDRCRAAAPWRRVAGLALLAAGLSGCGSLLGGKKEPTTTYAPAAHVPEQAQAQWPQVRWQLALARPGGARDSLRIAVRPSPSELQVYKGAQWAKTPGEMLEDAVLHALEDSGRIPVVSRQGSGVGADYRLLLDVRRFESDYAGAAVPSATIEVTAKLLHVRSQQLAGSHTFLRTQAAGATAVPEVVTAFDTALAQISGDIAGWALSTGEAFQRTSPGPTGARR